MIAWLATVPEKIGELVMGPIVLKEVRGTFRTRRFFLAQLIPMLIIGAVVMLVAVVLSADPTVRLRPERIGKWIYGFFFVAQSSLLLLVLPAFSCTSITEERELRTFDLLITSSLKPWEIVWGKVVAAMAYVLVFLLSTSPLVFISFLFGGVSPQMLLIGYLMLFVQGVVITVFSVFCSSLVRTTKVATMIAYLPIIAAGSVIVPLEIAFVVALLTSGWGSMLADLGGIGTFNQIMALFAIPGFLILSLCVFLFLLAVNRIRPVTGNRSTPMRIFATVFLLACSAVFLAMVWANRTGLSKEDMLAMGLVFYIPGALLLLFCTMAFPFEELDQSSRLRLKMAWLKGRYFLLRVFGTGAMSGAVFNLLLCGVVLAVPAGVLLVMFHQASGSPPRFLRGWVSLPLTALAAWAFLYFISMLGLLLSTFRVRPIASRCVVFFLVTLLAFGPFFHVMWMSSTYSTNRPTILSGHYLSPIVAWLSIWLEDGRDAFNSDQMLHLTFKGPGLIRIHVVHIAVYTLLASVLAVVNAIRAPRAKARIEAGTQ